MTTKRLLRALGGEAVWPPPVWLMRQAGRYLPEFRAMRAQADFITRCMTPDIATELTLQPIRRFGMDGAILFSDILILPWAMGQSLHFVDGTGPVLEPIRSRADLARLDPRRVVERTAPVMEALRRLRAALDAPAGVGVAPGGGTTLIGFAGAPFTVACYMVDGGGSREFAHTRLMAYSEPVLFERLMALLIHSTADMLCAQIEAGAEAVMLFDSWAGLLPPGEFARHVIAPARAIVQAVHASYPEIPVIGFPRLGGVSVGRYATLTGVQAVGLDTGVDLEVASTLLPTGITTQGNLDPLALLAGGRSLADAIEAIRTVVRGRPHVFNLGHGVLPQTPPEHVAALVEAVRHA
ncbi:uroporphyrinogen decarboxylase [Lichenicoccus sp.]|uniref:uroporphyrinogen decarboxylase n=1 Tax=Lichenicoccus sp. TaxID=2781899 RepID=UPI003D0C892C